MKKAIDEHRKKKAEYNIKYDWNSRFSLTENAMKTYQLLSIIIIVKIMWW